MYKKGDIHLGDPDFHGRVAVCMKKEQTYLATGLIGCNLYVVGYKKQVKELIRDLTKLLPKLED